MKLIDLPQLPFSVDALEPIISSKTVLEHYGHHHAGYVTKYNDLITKPITNSEDIEFNYNGHILHTLYWENLIPERSDLKGTFLSEVMLQFENINRLKALLVQQCLKIKGSGWVALVAHPRTGKLCIKSIQNHDISSISSFKPLLIIDGWEHAYYLDYASMKKEFFSEFVKLVNWNIVSERYNKV